MAQTKSPNGVLLPNTIKLAIVAGEASGDKLGGHLLDAFQAKYHDRLILQGVGGVAMEKSGLTSWFPMRDLSHMGLSAVISNLPLILKRLRQTIRHLIMFEPDILVLIDSPDFTHRVAKAIRKRKLKTVIINLAPPTVWAWRPWRARKMRPYIDLCLGIFPFEKKIYQELGGPPLTYIGHPMIMELPESYHLADIEASRARKVHKDDHNIIVLMPGSRSSLISKHLPVFSKVLKAFQAKTNDSITLVIPTIPACYDLMCSLQDSLPYPVRIVVDDVDREAAIKKARVGIFSFGTGSLEGAIRELPMINIFRPSRIETMLFRPLLTIKHYALPNIIHGAAFIPESFSHNDSIDDLADKLLALWQEGSARKEMIEKMQSVKAIMLSAGHDPAKAALGAIEDFMAIKGKPL